MTTGGLSQDAGCRKVCREGEDDRVAEGEPRPAAPAHRVEAADDVDPEQRGAEQPEHERQAGDEAEDRHAARRPGGAGNRQGRGSDAHLRDDGPSGEEGLGRFSTAPFDLGKFLSDVLIEAVSKVAQAVPRGGRGAHSRRRAQDEPDRRRRTPIR